jgi:coenzyme F420-reducing hydrogenase delta subunit
MLHAFTMGAEGVFVAGCGDQCARENTGTWVRQRVGKVQKALQQIGLDSERLQVFVPGATSGGAAKQLDEFVERIGRLHLTSVLTQEVKR